MSSLKDRFQEKIEATLKKIKSLEEFRKSDVMVGYVLEIASSMFKHSLASIGPGNLVQIGGKMAGAHAYLAQIESRLDAESRVYEQKFEEMRMELELRYYKDTNKIMHARSQAKLELNELAELVIVKKSERDNFHYVVAAAERLVGFIQSAIRVKEGERYQANSKVST